MLTVNRLLDFARSGMIIAIYCMVNLYLGIAVAVVTLAQAYVMTLLRRKQEREALDELVLMYSEAMRYEQNKNKPVN